MSSSSSTSSSSTPPSSTPRAAATPQSSTSKIILLSTLVAILSFLYMRTYSCPNLPSIKNSVVLITGSSSGIGEELAYQYAELGANVVLAARRASELERVAEGVRARGASGVLVVPTDMSVTKSCEELIEKTIATFGSLDTLILNHAAFDDKLFLSYNSSEQLEDTMSFLFRVNVIGTAVMSHTALPYLEKTKGYIGIVSSGTAKVSAPFHSIYASTKKALHGLFDSLRHELHLVGSQVTIGIHVLGMIGTEEVMKDEKLRGLAMPVKDCGREMICAVQAKFEESYIPKWLSPWTLVTYLHSWIAEASMNNFYIFNVPRYVETIAQTKERIAKM